MSKDKEEKDWDDAIDLLVTAIKVIRPSITNKQAENVIINIGNKIQLRRLTTKGTHDRLE